MKKVLNVRTAGSLLVIICLLFTQIQSVSAAETGFDAADMYVMEQLQTFSDSKDIVGLTWNDKTEIQDRIPLYEPNGEISGYIYHFMTDGMQTGFMQVQEIEGTYTTVNLGFTGDDVLTRLVKENRLTRSQMSDGKIYYCGNYDYFCEIGEENVYSLNDRELVDDFQDLEQCYKQYESELLNSMQEELCQQETVASVSAATKYVPGFGMASSYLKSTNYYAGYENHCAPTAGTNIVLYWRYSRGADKLSNNPTTVFNQLYRLMGTTDGGTSRSRIKPAMENYLLSYYTYSEVMVGQYDTVTFSKVKGSVASGYPVILSVNNWQSTGNGHAIDVWGYSENGGTNYYCITDNQDSNSTNTPSPYLINSSSYSFAQGVYAGLA